MRSMFMLVALAAAIGFTGCCGTGGSCKLGNCKLGSSLGAGKTLLSSAGSRRATQATSGSASYASMNDCGCGATGNATGACGPDSVISISAPYACDGGCGSASPIPMSAPSSCGCSSCDGGGAVEYAPAPSSGCSACESAQSSCGGGCDSAQVGESRGILTKRSSKKDLSSNKGLGLFLKGKGKACEDRAQPCSLFGKKKSRSLKSSVASDSSVSTGCGCDACSGDGEVVQTVAQMPGDMIYGGDAGGRRISTGIISDIRGGIGRSGHRARGCRVSGCGVGGKLCGTCSKAAGLLGAGHPYGGSIPHTNPAMGQQPQSGIAPQYAYPYYTTRGPRDFLRDNPPSIGY